MIAFQIDILISTRGNNTAAFFLYAKSATNIFLVLMAQTLKRFIGLILLIGKQLGKVSLNDNKPEIWKLNKFHKLDIT